MYKIDNITSKKSWYEQSANDMSSGNMRRKVDMKRIMVIDVCCKSMQKSKSRIEEVIGRVKENRWFWKNEDGSTITRVKGKTKKVENMKSKN